MASIHRLRWGNPTHGTSTEPAADPNLQADAIVQASELPLEDRTSLLNILDALLTKNRVRAVVSGDAS